MKIRCKPNICPARRAVWPVFAGLGIARAVGVVPDMRAERPCRCYYPAVQNVLLPSAVHPCSRLLAVLGLWLLLGIAAHAGPQGLTPCRIDGIKAMVQCGLVSRALDPGKPDGTKIEVHYVVVPALARRKWLDPVFFVAGGPGQSAIKVAPLLVAQMARLNNRRDLVFVDQRGTGRSAPLECEDQRHASLAEQLDIRLREAALARCLAQLKKLPYGDLRFFTTVLASQDMDAVRLALGASRINVVGGSYGTRAALDYARQFPHAVRSTVIDGVAPPDMVLPMSFSTDGQAVFDAMLSACEQDAACVQNHPALRANWARVLADVPRLVSVDHPMTGRGEQILITRAMILGWVRLPLYAPASASALPLAIDEAARGRFASLLGLGMGLGGHRAGELALGMHFSVVCAEDFPRLALATDRPGTDFGSDFAQLYASACANWPRGEVPGAFYTMPAASAPTLVLSGGLDPVTPARHGARTASSLGVKARHVVVANAGHGVMSLACMRDAVVRFIDAPDESAAAAVDTGCAAAMPRPRAFVALSPASASNAGTRPGVAP